jgi:large repetitive protein
MKDNEGLISNEALVSITILAVNDAPVAANDAYSVNEDGVLTVAATGVLINDSDVDNSGLTVSLVDNPQHGQVALNGNGSFTFTPAANFNGVDSFTYKATDDTADSNTATVTITINAVNDAPVAAGDSYSTDEDTTLTVTAPGVLGNDTDIEASALVATLVASVTHGTLTLNADGSFVYTPTLNFNGSDSFTYKANDGQTDSNVVTVTITVKAVNDAPVAVGDSYTTNEDSPLTVVSPGVLTNDTDVDSANLSAVLIAGVQHGTLTLNANGSFVYTPAVNFNGSDSFTYKASDGIADSNVATVSITVNSVNDAPVAFDDSYNTDQNTPLTITAAQSVLSNDTDIENDSLTAVLISGVAHGTLTLNANGSFTYTPTNNYVGPDSFTYRANDGAALSNIAVVSMTIIAANAPPVAVNDSYSTNEDTPLIVSAPGLLSNDTDSDSVNLTAKLGTGPLHGTLALNINGSFSYTPSSNFFGTDSFTYRASDGERDSNEATVQITIHSVNDPPSGSASTVTTPEDTAYKFLQTDFGFSDPNDNPANAFLAVKIITLPATGTLTNNGLAVAAGQLIPASDIAALLLQFTPVANANGSPYSTFTFQVQDNGGTVNEGIDLDPTPLVLTVNVTPVNDAPTAVADAVVTDEDTPKTIDVLSNDTDVDSTLDPTSVVVTSSPSHGTVSVSPATGVVIYTPAANYFGSDSFAYTMKDSGGLISNAATVSITVNAVNDAPVAANNTYSVDEDTLLTAGVPGVLNNDTDVDGDTLTAILVTGVTHGTLTLNPNGSLSYTPTPNFFGSDAFTYRATDGAAVSGLASVNITIVSVNDPPTAANDAATTIEDTPVIINVLANDSFAPDVGETLTVSVVTPPANGTAILNVDGTITYTPSSKFTGQGSFTYRVSDGQAFSNVATVAIQVIPSNHPPVANDDTATTNEDTPVTIAVLGNDQDADGDTLIVTAFTQPAHGLLTLSAGGSLTYAPESNFAGTDAFTYTITDEEGETSTARVTVNVISVNDAPVIDSLSVTPEVNEGGVVSLHGVFSDSDLRDSLAVIVDWGDGVVESFEVSDRSNFWASHQYVDDNPTGTTFDIYEVSTVLKDGNGGQDDAVAPVRVNNVAPEIHSITGLASAVRGQLIDFEAHFDDAGLLDSHEVTWDFGDGTKIVYGPGTVPVVQHRYTISGAYTVTLTVRDDDGGSDSVSMQVTIGAVSLQVDPCESNKTALVIGGTNADDKIRFIPVGNTTSIKVLINGVSQGTFTPTGRIIVYGLGGDDDIEVAGSIGLSAILHGDEGNDRLKGGGGPSVLLGGDGDDLLLGGNGRSVLVGGRGADRLVGNSDDDILIAGTTDYDDDHEAWCEILDVWKRFDLTYTQRVSILTHGLYKLDATTVFDDEASDFLTGSSGLDWFFVGVSDKITDLIISPKRSHFFDEMYEFAFLVFPR